ncbi:MAG: zinc ribbon domain-containing protein [Opitutales bacterium]|tara:strand:+ start:103 stop:819 length:717 start_codon:yes stop_codon:yes gene_type:complete
MLSNNPEFQELLLLHGRDRRYGKLEEELKLLPDDIKRMEKKISTENESIDLAVSEWKQLESQNNSLEKEIIEIGEKISKSKVRQLGVKKNEEYQALENEISSLTLLQSQKEDEQIEVLVNIDDAKATAEIAQDKIVSKVKDLERQKQGFEDRIAQVKTELQDLHKEIETARTQVEAEMLKTYDRVKKVVARAPYLAPLKDQKCSGCNLRVSNDVISTALVEQKLTQCDQCGRIVYVER